MSVCLDSWAILAWLDGQEPAMSRLNALIESRPIVSLVNPVEVHYPSAITVASQPMRR